MRSSSHLSPDMTDIAFVAVHILDFVCELFLPLSTALLVLLSFNSERLSFLKIGATLQLTEKHS